MSVPQAALLPPRSAHRWMAALMALVRGELVMSDMASRVCVLLFALFLNASGAPVTSAAPLDDLDQLWYRDTTQAVIEAERMGREAVEAGDPAAALVPIEVLWSHGENCRGGARVIDTIAAAAIPLAEAKGNWRLLARLYHARCICTNTIDAAQIASNHGRLVHFGRLAAAAAEKAGLEDTWLPPLRSEISSAEKYGQFCAEYICPHRERTLGPERYALLRGMHEAAVVGDDTKAVDIAIDLLESVSAADVDATVAGSVATDVCFLLWIPGMESALPQLRLVALRGGALGPLIDACLHAWDGRDGPVMDTLRWLIESDALPAHSFPDDMYKCSQALRRRGRVDYATLLATSWLRYMVGRHPAVRPVTNGMYEVVVPLRSSQVYVKVGQLLVEQAASVTPVRMPDHTPAQRMARVVSEMDLLTHHPLLDRDAAMAAAPEVASMLVAASLEFPPGSAAAGVDKAAELYAFGGRDDLAAECRALAKSIAERDPRAMLQLAITSARAMASAGKWEDVAKALEEPAGLWVGTVETLQAALFLHEAYLRTGKTDEAEKWMQKAWELVNAVKMTPAEKANYLTSMANLCDVGAQIADGRDAGR